MLEKQFPSSSFRSSKFISKNLKIDVEIQIILLSHHYPTICNHSIVPSLIICPIMAIRERRAIKSKVVNQ